MHRILHIGLGPLGQVIVGDMARRGICTVVAAVDLDPTLAGRPLSEVVPGCGFEVPVLGSIAEVTDWSGIDAAVVTTSSDLARCAPTLLALAERKVSSVSTCEELLFPWLRHPRLAGELEAACVRHGVRMLGTGVNPGFVMDTLPVVATAVCRDVRRVKVSRIQDATTRRIPFQQKIGAGLDDAQFAARVRAGTLRHVGLGESLHFLALYLGLPIERWEESIEPVKATRALSCGLGAIPVGTAAGVRQVAFGWAKGSGPGDPPVIELEFQAAIGQADPHDRVLIEGDPPIDLVIKNGVHGDVATSAITLNAIGPMLAAPPGLHTMATVPLTHFVRA